jgi:hypothetical protein
MSISENELQERAQLIVNQGNQAGARLRLLGGLAVRFSSPVGSQHPRLHDEQRAIKDVFLSLGYTPDQRFNALHGRTRLIFYDPNGEDHIDIFLDYFSMCHKLDLRQRLFDDYIALSAADLLITKLQIVQMNEKDMRDILAILLDHEIGDREQLDLINVDYLGKLTANDWGLYTTLSDNLKKTRDDVSELLDETENDLVVERIDQILNAMARMPKSIQWQLRSKIGRRMEWYDLPDEVRR